MEKKVNLIDWQGTLARRRTLMSASRQAAGPASDTLIIIISSSLADGKHIRLACPQLVQSFALNLLLVFEETLSRLCTLALIAGAFR